MAPKIVLKTDEFTAHQRYFYFTLFKCFQMIGSMLCTLFWLKLMDSLQWQMIYYIWAILSTCTFPLAFMRLIQLKTEIGNRRVSRKLEVGVDTAGYISHMLAGIFCYTERHDGYIVRRIAYLDGLWVMSVTTAIIYALDGWLLFDTMAEKSENSRLVPKNKLQLLHFKNTRLWKETTAMYRTFSRLPIPTPASLNKALIIAPSLATILHDRKIAKALLEGTYLSEVVAGTSTAKGNVDQTSIAGCSDKAVDIGESDTDVSKDEESHDEVQSEEASSVSVHESTKETRSMSSRNLSSPGV
ncbi:uncharacterized protein isoform X2 [Rhodnius prolixus]|uniref:uncharacterized protein isoform X2 n=1 Tax=Rhodnius prolixus TaxID=13249 RepID=UPI003D18B47D